MHSKLPATNQCLLFLLVCSFWTSCNGSSNRYTQRHQQGERPQRISIQELLHNKYQRRISNDFDVDICKAGGFMGDMALPNLNYEQEYLQLKKEVSEGLQVEEEGLTDYLRIKLKQAAPHIEPSTTKPHYNDPATDKGAQKNTAEDSMQSPDTTLLLKKTGFNFKNNNKPYYVQEEQTGKTHNFTTTDGDKDDKLKDLLFQKDASDTTNVDYARVKDDNFLTDVTTPSGGFVEKKRKIEKRDKKRHRRRRRRYRKRRLYSTTTKPNITESNSDTLPQPSTSSPLPIQPLIIASDNNDDTVSDKQSFTKVLLAVRQASNGTGNYETVGTINSTIPSRVSRSLTTTTADIIQFGEKPQENKVVLTNSNSRLVPTQEADVEQIVEQVSEIPVHEFDERFESPRALPVKKVMGRGQLHIKNDIFEDDIEPLPSLFNKNNYYQRRITRAATARKERVWDYGVIPYEIDINFSGAHKALFKQAMRHWENSTCVKFVERVPEEHPNYIIFTERPCGCCSFVGKRGNGAQAISIGKNCDKFGIVVHELGHVVGFWHEHTRPDRDHHVQIFREHIMTGQEYNFNKLTEEEVNSLGLPYDYDSIMHYAKNTFSRGSYLDTIAPQENKIRGKPVPEIGQRLRLSQGDIAQTNLLYKCYKCGRTLQENSGVFSSPNYQTLSNGESEKCEWRITVTHGERIVLNITDLDIFKSKDCGSDFIEIRDGYWYKSPMIGKFCGSGRLHETIVSTGSRMLVTYVASSKHLSHRGFAANYEAVCGGELEVTSGGHLESPNYPEDYLKNKECRWKLVVPPSYTVALRFQSFEIENHDSCVYDYVEVIDGFAPNSPVIGKFCGCKIPPDIESTSNHLQVIFYSDSSVQKAGFSATFMKEYNECDHTNHGCEQECINTLGSYECACRLGFELHSDGKRCEAACGGIFDSPNGTITSPSFPALYPENKNCIWEIIAPPQYRITLNFTHFDLEGNNLYQQECDYDSVLVQSKLADEKIKKHGTYCGSMLPDMITSEGNTLRIVFNSDFTVQKSGFAAVFFTDMDECSMDNGGCQHECTNIIGSYKCSCHNGFTLHENGHDCKEGGCKFEVTKPHGEIQSPNYPENYPSLKDCVWHFVTTPGHRIKLNFEKFEMEPHPECAYDHIVLYDGDSPESRTLGRYCGSKTPHPIIASGNQMFMVFKSDSSVQRKGFRAIHSTACGGLLQATNTVKHFYSHSRYGDYTYSNKMDCEWTIQPDSRRSVVLTFLTFDLEDEVTMCSYDYVRIVAGLDGSGVKYGKHCGSKIPPTIISNGDALIVKFRTDDSIVGNGFSASYVTGEQWEGSDEIEIMGFESFNKEDKDDSSESF